MKEDQKCTHPENHVHAEQQGGTEFIAGEIFDTTRIVWVCDLCGEVVGEE